MGFFFGGGTREWVEMCSKEGGNKSVYISHHLSKDLVHWKLAYHEQ